MSPTAKTQARSFSLIAAVALLAACGETGPSQQFPPATVTNISGGALSGPAGEALDEAIVILVGDAAGNPLPGVAISFTAAAAGSSVNPATTVTDERGEARTRWTLGSTPGSQTLTVTAGESTTLQITATAGSPLIAALAVNAGNNQVGTTGAALPINPSVVARDAAGNPVANVTVFFTVMSGGGTIAAVSAVTNTQGIATPGAWTLGTSVGSQLLSAQVPQTGVANNPLIFTATASGGNPASVVAFSPTQQSAQVGTLVSGPPSVLVRDAGGNPVPNVTVTFSLTSGSGTLIGGTQTTNLQGFASVTSWRLGSTPGPNTVTAAVSGLTPITFTATGTAGAATQLQKSAGDNQTAPVNRPLPIAPQVRVLDAAGNGVSGVAITFAVASGGGSAVVANVTTGLDGRASIGAWILGATPGANTLTASAVGLGTVTFAATATAGLPVSMQPQSSVNQTGLAGQLATSPPSVVIRDGIGNPVSNVAVTFTVTAGNGSVQGAQQLTNATGIATVGSWTLGTTAGANTVVASSAGLASVTFNASTTGVPAQVVAFFGDNQAAIQNTQVPIQPSVRVTDLLGGGAAGVTVNFVVTSGGGNVFGASQVTDGTGVATVGAWTLGSGAIQTLQATVAAVGVAGNPVTFNATSATNVGITAQPPTNTAAGAPFNVSVQLQDANGGLAAVDGQPVTIAIQTGPGTINAVGTALTITTVGGAATFNVSLTGANGARTLRITSPGLTQVITATINIP